MGSLHEVNPSLWVATSDPGVGPSEELPSSTFDVAVIGGGIAGLSTARLLAGDGARVIVLEASDLAAGATGYTTAKVTALQRTVISDVTHRHGSERARLYAEANAASLAKIASLVAEDAIDCDFTRAPACTYTEDPTRTGAVETEYEACRSAGLPVRLSADSELPFPVAAAVWLDDQAHFHPRKYCLGLARAVVAAGGVVETGVRVLDVDETGESCRITTDRGELAADRVVIATLLPFPKAGGYFARAHAHRSYAMAARTAGSLPEAMYISVESPVRSVRPAPDGWLILGGEGHKVGQDDDTRARYSALEQWARATFAIDEIGFRWSAQDYETVDGLPYIGPLSSGHSRISVATGFGKWGMTNGTVAGMVLSDALGGRQSPWAEVFDTGRISAGASIKNLVTENLNVGGRMIGDRVRSLGAGSVDELAPGQGEVVRLDGRAVAAFRDDDGELHLVSANCTHMGCRVTFNTAERSWDCPCHGSRFGCDGRVLQGPAVHDLDVVPNP